MIRGDVTDQIAWRLWSEGWTGFEQPLPDLFAACCRNAMAAPATPCAAPLCVLDIGANSGLYALIAAAVAPTAQGAAGLRLRAAAAGARVPARQRCA